MISEIINLPSLLVSKVQFTQNNLIYLLISTGVTTLKVESCG